MNPFYEYRKAYIAACFAIAATYAFTAGNLPVAFRITDACIYGCLLCLAGITLWNIFAFAFPKHYEPRCRILFFFVLAVLSSVLIVGTETFLMYLLIPSLFEYFVATVPVRIFITLLTVVLIRLYYLLYSGKKELSPVAAQPVDRITIRSGQKIKIIPIDEIIYIKADGDYVSIHTSTGNWLKEQTMKHTEDMLPADKFVRIHRSYIVNTNHIIRIECCGEHRQVVLLSGEKIKISAARYHSLKQILGF